MPRNGTVGDEGAKQVKIGSMCYKKQRVIVKLCITADGHKLPSYVSLHRRAILKD
jgi:hypothetical protein